MKRLNFKLFEDGTEFILSTDIKRGTLKAHKTKGFVTYSLITTSYPGLPNGSEQIAIVNTVDVEGFEFVEYFLGKEVRGKVLFKDCIVCEK